MKPQNLGLILTLNRQLRKTTVCVVSVCRHFENGAVANAYKH